MQVLLTGIAGAGYHAIIDDADAPLVTRYSWHYRDGYAVSKYFDPLLGKRRTIQMHRLVMGVEDPFVLVDHKDRNRLNNTRENLVLSTPKENSNNMATNRILTGFGESKTMAQWADDPRCEVSYGVLCGRVRRTPDAPLEVMLRRLE